MPDIQKWQHLIMGYTMGHSKFGNPCWVEAGTGEESPASLSDSLANFGKDGWELVSTIFLHHGPDGNEIMCFFKKPA
jgi:hypothetical protein